MLNKEILFHKSEIRMIKQGQTVSLEYTVFLQDGTKVDTNVGEDPLVFVFGAQQLFPALESAVQPLEIGENKQVLLQPEEAYGPVVADAFREVDVEMIPANYRYQGAVLGVQDPQGGLYPIRVHEISAEKAVLDFNHPLAGQALRFEVKVVQIDDK